MPKELYLNKPLDLQEWEANGKPIMWIHKYCMNKINIYSDSAFGHIKLVTPKGENVGKDMAIVENIVCFGSYYAGSGLKLFKPYKLIWSKT